MMPADSSEPQISNADKVHVAVARRGKRLVMDFFPNLRDAGLRWSEDDASSLAASVAYYLALSLFPMMLLLISGIGIFLRFTNTGKDAEQQILATVETHASPVVKEQIQQVLSQLRDHSLVSGPFGIVAAVFASIGVFAQLDRGFDRIFRIIPRKDASVSGTIVRVLRHRFFAFIMLVALGGLIVILFTASMLLAQLRSKFGSFTGKSLPSMSNAFSAVEFAFAILANALLFTLIFRVLPKRNVKWLDALRGGLLTAIVWELGREVLGVFLVGMRYTSAYGAIGSFIAILLWCYYGISILFFGAEYVQTLENRRQQRLAKETVYESDSSASLANMTDLVNRNEPRDVNGPPSSGGAADDDPRMRPRRSIADG